MTTDSLKQPNFGPDLGIQIAAFNLSLLAMNVQRDPIRWIKRLSQNLEQFPN